MKNLIVPIATIDAWATPPLWVFLVAYVAARFLWKRITAEVTTIAKRSPFLRLFHNASDEKWFLAENQKIVRGASKPFYFPLRGPPIPDHQGPPNWGGRPLEATPDPKTGEATSPQLGRAPQLGRQFL